MSGLQGKLGVLSWVAVAALAGCGGGGGDDTPATPVVAAPGSTGVWTGRTDTNRPLTAVVLDDGNFWVFYAPGVGSTVVAGAVQGTGTSANGSFTSTNAKDFNLEGDGILDLTVAASYTAQSQFNGRLAYSGILAATAFTSSYDAISTQQATLASVAGRYTGTAGVAQASEAATLTVSPTGAIAGSGSSGCAFTGTLRTRSSGPAFDLSVTFGGGVCANGTTTVNGIGYLDTRTGRLLGAALNGARSNGLIFNGMKTGA